MLPWWSWVLIWTGLVIVLLVMLGLFAWWLFRKFLVLLDDVTNLAERSAVLDIPEPTLVRPQLAVLAELRHVREREDARRTRRAERRRIRHERRMARATRIASVDPSTTQWPADWYHRGVR